MKFCTGKVADCVDHHEGHAPVRCETAIIIGKIRNAAIESAANEVRQRLGDECRSRTANAMRITAECAEIGDGCMTKKTMSIVAGGLLALTLPNNLANAASAFDGSYGGALRETKNNNTGACLTMLQDKAPIVIANGVLKYHWVGQVPLETTVSNDGSFSIDRPGISFRGYNGGSISFKGQIKGGNLEADVGDAVCAAHLSYKKS